MCCQLKEDLLITKIPIIELVLHLHFLPIHMGLDSMNKTNNKYNKIIFNLELQQFFMINTHQEYQLMLVIDFIYLILIYTINNFSKFIENDKIKYELVN